MLLTRMGAMLVAVGLGLGVTGVAAAEEFAIGVEVPLSGALARVGTGMSEGIQVAADVFNRKNGKHKVKLTIIDDDSSPPKAVAAVEKLASQNVVAITGGHGSSNIGPASDAAGKAGRGYLTARGGGAGLNPPPAHNRLRARQTPRD